MYLALGGVIVVFAGIVASVSLGLRDDLQEGILRREAEALRPLTQWQVDRYREDELFEGFEAEEVMVYALVDTYGMDGALGLQLFNREGRSIAAIPSETGPVSIGEKDLGILNGKESVSKISYGEAGYLGGNELADVVEMYLPVTYGDSARIEGFVRYALDGERILAEIAAMDAKLSRQALVSICSGSFLVSIILFFAISRLRVANEKLHEETVRLEAANTELEMLAKTSAVGAVASHLIHGLRNPLAGLRQHVESPGSDLGEEDWEDARSAAKRMQEMINEVIEVLRVDERGASYEATTVDFADELRRRFEGAAVGEEKFLEVEVEGEAALDARKFGIALLIVSNLTQNALEAVAFGGKVSVQVTSFKNRVCIEVSDDGKGFPEEIRGKLFSPGSSSKPSGAGIGLALCKQLARHIGADLELVKSDESGSSLRLEVVI